MELVASTCERSPLLLPPCPEDSSCLGAPPHTLRGSEGPAGGGTANPGGILCGSSPGGAGLFAHTFGAAGKANPPPSAHPCPEEAASVPSAPVTPCSSPTRASRGPVRAAPLPREQRAAAVRRLAPRPSEASLSSRRVLRLGRAGPLSPGPRGCHGWWRLSFSLVIDGVDSAHEKACQPRCGSHLSYALDNSQHLLNT